MGRPMAQRLTTAGVALRGFDVSKETREDLRAHGLDVADVASETALGADVVLLMLPNSDVVEAVVGELQAAAVLSEGMTVIDLSSSEPLRTRALAQHLGAQGVSMLDAPVSGGVKGAAGGTLTIMVGGPDELVAQWRPLLQNFGKVTHAGSVGSGHAVKALNNLLSATHLLATSEAMLAGEAFGLDPEVMLAIINGSSGRSGSTENKWPNFILNDRYDSGFALRLMLKDMKIAVDLAHQRGVATLLGDRAVSLWDKAAQTMAATADHTEIARWLRDGGEQE